jgi:hypothetical protein
LALVRAISASTSPFSFAASIASRGLHAVYFHLVRSLAALDLKLVGELLLLQMPVECGLFSGLLAANAAFCASRSCSA